MTTQPLAPLSVVEAFTTGNNDMFSGNTAAVCLLDFDDDISDEIKQKIAMNMNLSETAFVSKGWTKANDLSNGAVGAALRRWTLRWFTPTVEIQLCGHATLAASRIVFHDVLKKYVDETTTSIIFETKFRGELGATIDWSTDLITLDFPTSPSVPISNSEHNWVNEIIAKTLGPEFQLFAVKEVHYSPLSHMTMIVLQDTQHGPEANEALLKKVKPEFQAMLDVKSDGKLWINNIIVTIKGCIKGPTQFYSRFFAPWSGINEDPVTGSAHTVLVPYWKNEFEKQGINLSTLTATQSSGRGGRLICKLEADRVFLTGSTRLVFEGHLHA